MKLRIEQLLWESLCESLLARRDVESAAILLAEPLGHGELAVVRDRVELTEADYLVRELDQLSLDPVLLNRVTKRARSEGRLIFTVHTHPGASVARFSRADDAGDARLMPYFHRRVPGGAHGSIVIAERDVASARVFTGEGVATSAGLQVIGKTVRTLNGTGTFDDRYHERQRLALGAAGQRQLRSARIGVVGLGGIGSVAAMQLAHLGVGQLVLVDGDHVEASNISRIVGATAADVGMLKVDVAARYARALGLGASPETIGRHLDAEALASLASCDLVLSCVDRQTPRAQLNRLAYAALSPVVDLGVAFRVDPAGAVTGDAGRVVVVGPGRSCLACWGYLDAVALRNEALSPEQRAELLAKGYIQGAEEYQPSVIAFNTSVAGAGVVEALRILTGFAGVDSAPAALAFSFSQGTVRRAAVTGDQTCGICGA